MLIFRKCNMKLFLIVQVGDPFRLWLHFYSVFEFPPESVFHYFGLSWARLEKCIVQSAENFKEHRFHFFDILRILEPVFQNIHIPGPRKSVLGSGDVFGTFSCPKIIDLFTIWKIFYEFGLIRGISWSYRCYLKYGITTFLKAII